MFSEWNTPTVLPWGVNSTFNVSADFRCLSGLMRLWEQLVLVLGCLRSRSSIIGPPSVVGRSVLSSEKLFIELLRNHALVVLWVAACCPQKNSSLNCCAFMPKFYCVVDCVGCVMKTVSLTCVKHRRRRVALEEGPLFEVDTEWYWVVATV